MATFVLVHGAWSGEFVWTFVAAKLRARGHRVFTPTLAGVGDRASEATPETDVSSHARDVQRVFESEDLRDTVLVGFSYGGFVVTKAAEWCASRIRKLIYLDAFLPHTGKSMLGNMPPFAQVAFEHSIVAVGDGWKIPPMPVARLGGRGAGAPDDASVAALLARRVPQPSATFREAFMLEDPTALAIPVAYIHCTDKDPPDPFVMFADLAAARGFTCRSLPTGHFAALTMPEELTQLLCELA